MVTLGSPSAAVAADGSDRVEETVTAAVKPADAPSVSEKERAKRQRKKKKKKAQQKEMQKLQEASLEITYDESLLWCIEKLKKQLMEPGVDQTEHGVWCAKQLKKLLDSKLSKVEKCQLMRHSFGDYKELIVQERAKAKQ